MTTHVSWLLKISIAGAELELALVLGINPKALKTSRSLSQRVSEEVGGESAGRLLLGGTSPLGDLCLFGDPLGDLCLFGDKLQEVVDLRRGSS